MHDLTPKAQRVVLIGGGHTHALVLRTLAMKPLPGAEIIVVNAGTHAPYTGMLPGLVAGHYRREEVEIDLQRLCRAAGATFINSHVTGIDPAERTVATPNRPPLLYDIASINLGITGALDFIDGFAAFGHPAKPLGKFAARWEHFVANLPAQPSAAVIGAGIAGVELALNMSYRIARKTGKRPALTLIESQPDLLPAAQPGTRARLRKLLEQAEISIRTSSRVTSVQSDSITLEDGTDLPSRFTVGAAGATPHEWIKHAGLSTTSGFINVDAALCVQNQTGLFAVGDCAHFMPAPLPKAGVYAVRQAPLLLRNIKAALQGTPLKHYRPQSRYLKLISTGPKSAVAEKYDWLSAGGPLLWHLKDRIDRRFMDRLNKAPLMPPKEPERGTTAQARALGEKYSQMCGGCGAKMDKRHLSRALESLNIDARPDVMTAAGDDAATLITQTGYQVLSNDHLRNFISDPWRMGKIAANHALGDIWAMGAQPQSALATIILPPMADHLHEETLKHILHGANTILAPSGAALLGGHTSIGSELTVGFSLTGLRDAPPILQTGASPGDCLILTKPLGVGTLLAAEMRGLARGSDVELAYQQMEHPSAGASAAAQPFANAMTDVTGYGLAGHLKSMMEASNTSATLDLPEIPRLAAAETLAQKGIRSSLWQSNRAALPSLEIQGSGAEALLFDPQTAGGLLVSLPEMHAPQVLDKIRESDPAAAIIGKVGPGPARITIQGRA